MSIYNCPHKYSRVYHDIFTSLQALPAVWYYLCCTCLIDNMTNETVSSYYLLPTVVLPTHHTMVSFHATGQLLGATKHISRPSELFDPHSVTSS